MTERETTVWPWTVFKKLNAEIADLRQQLAAAQAREQSVLKTAAIVDSNLYAAIDDEYGDEQSMLGALMNAHVDLAMLQRDQPDHAALEAVNAKGDDGE